MSQGEEARVFYLSSLFDEIDWRDRLPKDNQKILNLREEIIQILQFPNFVTLICQSYESGNRQRILQTSPTLPEELAPMNVSLILGLTPSESLAFAFALMHSQHKYIANISTILFKSKLLEINSFRDLSENTVHSIIHYLSTSEDDFGPSDVIKRVLQIAASSFPSFREGDQTRQSIPQNVQSRQNVARALNEIGYKCSRTVETFRHTLYSELEITSLDETTIADILYCCLIPHATGDQSNTGDLSTLLHSLLSGTPLPADFQREWWSIETIFVVLSEDCRSLNWNAVLRALDRVSSPYLPNESEFFLFLKYLTRLGGRPVSVVGLMSAWENRVFQLACITHAADAPRALIDFSELFSLSNRLDAGPDIPIPTPPNGSWLCVQLYSTLLAIAGRGNTAEVMKLLTDAAIQYPEYVFLGLAQTTDQNSGVRTELLRRLIRYFTGLNGSRPSSGAVMSKLYEVNQDLLVLILRISLKNSTTVQEILNIDARLKSFGNANGNNVLLYRIQEECTLDEILPYWCVIADYQRGPGNHLEERLLSILVKNPSYARNIVLFAKTHIDTLRPRMATEASSGILSYENFVTILKCSQQYPTIVSSQDVRTLAGLANQRQQQQLQAAQSAKNNQLVNGNIPNVPVNNSGYNNTDIAQGPPNHHHHQQQQQQQAHLQQAGIRPTPVIQSQPQPNAVIDQTNTTNGPNNLRPALPGDVQANGSNVAPSGASLGTSEEIEEVANSYFQKIYTSNMSINDVIVLLKRFKTSTEPREQEIFRCMIHNLFDEYRFFHKYPEKELQLTGRLFGTLIQHQLVSSITLGIALRYVLEALRKDPEQGGSNEKMFRFGKIALEQFRSRLGEWPQYCSHLVQITHLVRHCADLFREAQRAISNPGANASTASNNPNLGGSNTATPAPVIEQSNTPNTIPITNVISSAIPVPGLEPTGSAVNIIPVPTNINANINPNVNINPNPNLNVANSTPNISSEVNLKQVSQNNPSNAFSAESTYESATNQTRLGTTEVIVQQSQSNTSQEPVSSVDSTNQSVNATGDDSSVSTQVEERRRKAIDRMYAINMEAPEVHIPSEAHRDQILFIINNIAKNNVETKTKELKGILDVTHYSWFANYLIVKRISTQPNLHATYLAVIDLIESPQLVKAIMLSGYHNVTKLLQSSKITNSSSERSLLRNLGIWLGQLTLSRNKPLLQRRCDLKELLLWGYEDGRLIAVCSFVAKILEGCKDSKIFRPPNPWLMSILGVMRELYEIEDLKMNIKFEVQVLCKNIGVKIEDIPKTNALSRCLPPIKEKNPDFNIRGPPQTTLTTSPMTQITSPQFAGQQIINQGTPIQTPAVHHTGYGMMMIPPAAIPLSAENQVVDENRGVIQDVNNVTSTPSLSTPSEQIVIPNLASHVVINSSLYYLIPGNNAAALLRRIVPLAVDKAILEIITPVVERCVTMASVTTQHLVLKDFAQEPNENHLRRAAHQMISNLAGSLALVTCKEPLRVSMSNYLRSLLASTNIESSVIDQIVLKCSSDNLDLGCMLIEKAATERAIRDIDEALAGPIKLRKKHIESGAPVNTFSDTTSLSVANITNVITKGVTSSGKYPRDLPDSMKSIPGGLSQSQLHVYDGFQRQRLTVPTVGADSNQSVQVVGQQGMSPSPHSMSPSPQVPQPQQPSLNANLSMAQSLEAYQIVLSRVDNLLKSVMIQAQGRDVSLSMLGGDHEIVTKLREIMHITQCTQAGVRIESALTFAESVFKRLVETVGVNDTLRLEVMVGILEALRDACGGSRKFIPDITDWLNSYATFSIAEEASRKILRDILTLLMRAKLLSPANVDLYFANNLDSGRNMLWVEMSLAFIRHSLAEGLAATYEYSKVFDIVAQMRPSNPAVRKSLQKWLTDIRTLAAARDEQKVSGAGSVPVTQSISTTSVTSSPGTSSAPASSNVPAAVPPNVVLPPIPPARDHARERVTSLLDEWLRGWQSADDKVFARYLQILHQNGVLKTEEAADKFFRLSVEICVEACLKSGQPQQSVTTNEDASASSTTTANSIFYVVVDALSKLFLLLIRLADKEATDSSVRINLLGRILNAIARVLVDDERKKRSNSAVFDQRPYYRLFSNLMQSLGPLDPKLEAQETDPTLLMVLSAYTQIFLALQPTFVPGFAFSWLQLISHRCFMPHLLQGDPRPRGLFPQKVSTGWGYMHRLLLALLLFLQPFLKTAQLIEPIKHLYKGTLKVLLIILHDFPEFLVDYHLSFCEAIPSPCIQLRNLITSAFPRTMRLPDPFTPGLRINFLPEIIDPPRILADITTPLAESGLRPRLDTYLTNKQPPDFLDQLLRALTCPYVPGEGSLHLHLTTCMVMYVASYGVSQLLVRVPITKGVPMDIWRHMINSVDPETRYSFLNILVNQLRYPSSHTNYFSCVILALFTEATGIGGELIQEQITRVLLERLIVHRPHPWGLLVSFIDLIKNPRYNFWSKPFVKCSPEVERIFDSVSRTCNGPDRYPSSTTKASSSTTPSTTTSTTATSSSSLATNTTTTTSPSSSTPS